MPLLIPLAALLAAGAGATAYTAHEVRGGIQDATRSPVAAIWAVAALGVAIYLVRRK